MQEQNSAESSQGTEAEIDPQVLSQATDMLRTIFTGAEQDIPTAMQGLNELCQTNALNILDVIKSVQDEDTQRTENWEEYGIAGTDERKAMIIRQLRKVNPDSIRTVIQGIVNSFSIYSESSPHFKYMHCRDFTDVILRSIQDPSLTKAVASMVPQSADPDSHFDSTVIEFAQYVGVASVIGDRITAITATPNSADRDSEIFELAKSQSAEAQDFVIRLMQEGWKGESYGKSEEEVLAELAIQCPEKVEALIIDAIDRRHQFIRKREEQDVSTFDIEYQVNTAEGRYDEPKTLIQASIYVALARLNTPRAIDTVLAHLGTALSYADDYNAIRSTAVCFNISDARIAQYFLEYDITPNRQEGHQETMSQRIGKILRNAGLRYGSEQWNEFISPAQQGGNWATVEANLANILMAAALGPELNEHESEFLTRNIPQISNTAIQARPQIAIGIARRLLPVYQAIAVTEIPQPGFERVLDVFRLVRVPQNQKIEMLRLLLSVASTVHNDLALTTLVNDRLISFETLSDVPEAVDYVAKQTTKIFREDTGQLTDRLQSHITSLMTSNSRFATRTIVGFLQNPDASTDVLALIVQAYCNKGILDPQIIDGYHSTGNWEAALGAVRSLFGSEVTPTKESVKLYLAGNTPEDIQAKNAQNRHHMTAEERIADDEAASLEYACASRTPAYSNVFRFENYWEFVIGVRALNRESNPEVARAVQAQQAKAAPIEQARQALEQVYQEGIPDLEITVVPDANAERERRQVRVERQIQMFEESVERIVLIDNLLGRIGGIDRAIRKATGEDRDSVSPVLEDVNDLISTSARVWTNFDEVYERIYQVYAEQIGQLAQHREGIGNPPAIAELQDQDRTKFRTELTGSDQSNPTVVLQKLSKKIRTSRKRVRKLAIDQNEHRWNILLDDVSEALGKVAGSIDHLTEYEHETKDQQPRNYIIHFVPKSEPYQFMRVGDARESCIATDGMNNWSVPGFVGNEGTGAVIVIDKDTDLAVGHSMWHMSERADGSVGPMINGLFIDPDVPQTVGDKAINFIDAWAKEAGLAVPYLALSPYSDLEPDGWVEDVRAVRLLQGVQVTEDPGDSETDLYDLYYDFEAPIEEAGEVEVLVKESAT